MYISVCIPTYNQALYLEESINSVLSQTRPPDEIIVSNDCSTDGTKELLDKLSLKIKSLKVIHQPSNLGVSKNTNACLRAGKGDYIVRLDSDDCLLPDYIEKLSALLNAFPEAGYAHSAIQEIDEYGSFLQRRMLFRKVGFQSAEAALKASIYGYRVSANIIMFRKSALVKANYIPDQVDFVEDYYLSVNLASLGFGNVYSNETLALYRVWMDKGKTRLRRKLSEIIGYKVIFENVLEPAFISRDWDIVILKNKRTDFACTQADCLGWEIFNKSEKEELLKELYKLSNSTRVKYTAWLYLNKLGFMNKTYPFVKKNIKKMVKKIMY